MRKKKCSLLCMNLLLCCTMIGCKIGVSRYYAYKDSDKYSVGSGSVDSELIKSIEVDWISHDVIFEYSDDQKISFYEDVDEVSEKFQLHYYVDGDVLRIKFSKALVILSHSFIDKTLHIELPNEFVLKELDIDVVSSNIIIPNIICDDVDIDSVSGNITIEKGKAKNIDIDTVSGRVNCNLEVSNTDIETVSGKITAKIKQAEEINMETVSGLIELYLPVDSGFRLETQSVSGDVEVDFEVSIKNDVYTIGDQSIEIEIETISGDLLVKKIEE